MLSEIEKIRALQNSSLFKDIPDSELERLMPKFVSQTFPPNHLIFDDGSEAAEGMYVIAKGFVKIYKNVPGEENRQQAVAVLPAGSYFGEMALLDEDKRSAGAMTLYETELLFLSKAAFNTMIGQNLHLAHEMLSRIAKTMSKRLRDTNNLFREVVSWGYKARKEVRDMKTNFLSTISHELRTPIHSIQGFSALIKESKDVDDETRSKFIDVVLNESKRLADLINDLISLAEIEYGSIIIDRQPHQLQDLLEKSFDAFKSQAQEKRIHYRLLMPNNLSLIAVDGQRFPQAIEHIIENAIKFTGFDGSVTVEVSTTKNNIDIFVIDTGCGISSKYIERIFEKFYQVDQSTTRAVEGAGIGLSLARHIVDLHGGKITVESEEGKGSTFRLTFPKDQLSYNESA